MLPTQLCMLMAAVLCGFRLSDAQSCGTPPRPIFKRVADPAGDRSYITSTGSEVPYTADVPLPPVVVQLVSPLGDFDMTVDGLPITASVIPALRVSGNSARITRGEATFDALMILEEVLVTDPPVHLEFSVTLADGTVSTLMTGNLVHVEPSQHGVPFAARFANQGSLTRAGRSLEIPISPATFAPFSLEVVNEIGYAITVGSASVQVTATDADVSPSPLSALTITELMLDPHTEESEPTITFTVTADGVLVPPLVTGTLTPVFENVGNRFMLFDRTTSFITEENAGNTAVMGVPLPPVVINLYTSGMELDASNTGLIITATTAQGTLTGAEALVVRGVARFAELTFTGEAPRSAVITFTAGAQGSLPVQGRSLLSGTIAISATATKARYLSFAAVSTIQATDGLFLEAINSEFVVPSVVVQMLDSAYQVDTTASGISLKLDFPASAAGAAIPLDVASTVAEVTNGIAVFTGVEYTVNDQSFNFEITDPTAGDDGPQILSGLVNVRQNELTADPQGRRALSAQMLEDCVDAATTSCSLTLAFANEFGPYSSAVFEEGQALSTTVGAQLPTIVVELRDPFGVSSVFPSDVAPTLVAFTGEDPDAETLLVTAGGANQGQYQNGRYYFSCLQFGTVPTGLRRIQFMAVDERQTPVARVEGIRAGDPLRTGFVTVAAATVANAGMRFVAATSVVSYPGQASSAVLNMALPPVEIELVDSLGRSDTTDSSTVIVASVTSGKLDAEGSRVRVTNGVARFAGLKFTEAGQRTAVQFRAYQTDAPVAAQTLTTGVFLVTPLPIPDYEVAFVSTVTDFNDVTYAFQPVVLTTLEAATIKASVTVRDSAHRRVSRVGTSLFITPFSDEVNLESSEVKTIDSRSECACANFTNKIRGFKDGYSAGTPVYIRYTVTDAEGLLMGKSVVVGPIIVNELQLQGTTCSANLIAPVVVAEFRIPPSEFDATSIQSQLAATMGVDTSRVTILPNSQSRITRVDGETLQQWIGTRISLVFGDPTRTATNQKTSAQLAEDFVALRPRCDATTLELESAYYQSEGAACDSTAFQTSLEASEQCASEGISTECQCFDTGVIATWGRVCAEDPSTQSALSAVCQRLATAECAEAETQVVCNTVLTEEEQSWLWLWALLGVIGGLALVFILLRRKGLLVYRQKPSLKHQDGVANRGLDD